jgi:hypothetical protein
MINRYMALFMIGAASMTAAMAQSEPTQQVLGCGCAGGRPNGLITVMNVNVVKADGQPLPRPFMVAYDPATGTLMLGRMGQEGGGFEPLNGGPPVDLQKNSDTIKAMQDTAAQLCAGQEGTKTVTVTGVKITLQ